MKGKYKNQQVAIPVFGGKEGIQPLIKEQTYRYITIPLDGIIEDDLLLYRDCIEEIRDANEGDVVRVIINTDGGSLRTALAFITAIQQSDAEVVADIEGSASSAGSLIALHCDSVQLNPYSTMFIHAESFGSSGKRNEVKSQVEFSLTWAEKIIRDTYKHFLTDEEITQVLEGKDMYFNAEDVLERLKIRAKVLQEEYSEEQDGSNYDEEFYGDAAEPLDN